MKETAQETTPQIVLRNTSKEVWVGESTYVILVKGEFIQLSTYLIKSVLLVTRS